jgi:pimeloyl-ACP methyl ester carboxylesterase
MNDITLFMLRPYDPDRIPVIFVHGLISTPRMWRRVINELEADPEFRRHYQCWLYSYPTGNPPLYSALRFRQELASIERSYPHSRPYVMVGHSMGGLVSQMQVTSLNREDWNVIGKDKAAEFFKNVKSGDLVDQCTRFEANPQVDRVIFISTPHRGSNLALSPIAKFGAKLIALPGTLTSQIGDSVGAGLAVATGNAKRMPTSATELTPGDPTLVALDRRPIKATHHSIIGDRGKNDSPHSSDGVVEYWSSHLNSAKSEKIVPGPHGSCELPETTEELLRIFHLHLKKN